MEGLVRLSTACRAQLHWPGIPEGDPLPGFVETPDEINRLRNLQTGKILSADQVLLEEWIYISNMTPECREFLSVFTRSHIFEQLAGKTRSGVREGRYERAYRCSSLIMLIYPPTPAIEPVPSITWQGKIHGG